MVHSIRIAKRIGKLQNPIFLSVLTSMTGRWVLINMPYFANESVLTSCCLSRLPSLKIYTAAKKVYTISRMRL